MRARRRQAQRPRQCRLHRAASHLFRDARQFLVRRLFQGTRDRACVESDHQGIRPAKGQAARHRLSRRRRGGATLEEDRGLAGDRIIRIATLGQFLADGRYRPMRALLGNILSITATRSGADLPAPRRKTATASSRSGISCSCSSSRCTGQSASRCRGPRSIPARDWSAWPRPARQARQLRHRPVRRADPRHRPN